MQAASDSSEQFFARSMRFSDVDQVVQNEVAAYEHPWTRRIVIDCLRSGYQCWVLANKNRIAAHGILSVAVGECHLLTLCVHPDFQRLGMGRKLIRLLLERAYRLKAEQCFLEVRASNSRALSLYKELGFVQIGERKNYYPDSTGREDAIIMSRELPLP